jgi:hypothetical protein
MRISLVTSGLSFICSSLYAVAIKNLLNSSELLFFSPWSILNSCIYWNTEIYRNTEQYQNQLHRFILFLYVHESLLIVTFLLLWCAYTYRTSLIHASSFSLRYSLTTNIFWPALIFVNLLIPSVPFLVRWVSSLIVLAFRVNSLSGVKYVFTINIRLVVD